jgi:ABC-2 type transport system ATP-binding protein
MVGDQRNREALNELEDHPDIEAVEFKAEDDHLIVTLAEGVTDGSFIADILVKNGYRLKMLKEEAIDLEDVFMGITKGVTQ